MLYCIVQIDIVDFAVGGVASVDSVDTKMDFKNSLVLPSIAFKVSTKVST